MLIVFAGLPGTGKTSIAAKLTLQIPATFIRIDSIEHALSQSSFAETPMEDAGYQVGYAVARDNLGAGRTVIADSVNPIERTRTGWLDVAALMGCAAIEVEMVCSNETEHRLRIETRLADLSGQRLPTWQDVLDREYHAWNRERIVIDTADKPIDQCVDELAVKVQGFRANAS